MKKGSEEIGDKIKMKEYEIKRGATLEERIVDLKGEIKEYFGPINGTENREGQELYVVKNPVNPIFKKVSIGAGKYPGKKDTLIVDFEECPVAELKKIIADGNIELAADAVTMKNEFLLKATGKDSKARRKAAKREDKKGN